MTSGTVKTCTHGLDTNSIGSQSNNLILDMHLHDVEFPGGEVTLLPANDITQAMYAQHNVDGNKYLLLECFMNM